MDQISQISILQKPNVKLFKGLLAVPQGLGLAGVPVEQFVEVARTSDHLYLL